MLDAERKDTASWHRLRGLCLAQVASPAAAVEELTAAAVLDPSVDVGEYAYAVALRCIALGRPLAALEQLEAYLRSGDPAHRIEACLARAECLERLGRWRAAAQAYADFLSRFPASQEVPRAQLALGRILEERLGDYEGAASAYSTLASRFPGSPEAVLAKAALLLIKQSHPEDFKARPVVITRNVTQTSRHTILTGMIENKGNVVAGEVRVTAALLDRLGAAVAAATTAPDPEHIPPGALSQFEVTLEGKGRLELSLAWSDWRF